MSRAFNKLPELPNISRRKFLIGAGAVATVVGLRLRDKKPTYDTPDEGLESFGEYPALYESDLANEIALGLGVTPGEFFKVSPETITNIELRQGY
jgi:hypothetical protein